MKILKTLGCVVIFIAASVSYAAEPPQDKKPEAATKKVGDDIEIAVEKIERVHKVSATANGPTDLDGDGYGDVATQAQGDPIPGIDITVSQQDETAVKVPSGKARATVKKPAKASVVCKQDDEDCDN